MKKMLCLLLTLSLLFSLAACGSSGASAVQANANTAPVEATAAPTPVPTPAPTPEPSPDELLQRLCLSPQEAVSFCRAASGVSWYLVSNGKLYGNIFEKSSSSNPMVGKYELSRKSDGSYDLTNGKILLRDTCPRCLVETADGIYFIGLNRVTNDGSVYLLNPHTDEITALFDNAYEYLQLVDNRFYFVDKNNRYVSTDLTGGDRQTLVDREVYFVGILGSGWVVFQDDADHESMHLYHLPSGTDHKLNDEQSYYPCVIGSCLYFLTPAGKNYAYNINRVDFSDPNLTVTKSEYIVSSNLISDGEILYTSNNLTLTPTTWDMVGDPQYHVSAIYVTRYADESLTVVAMLYGHSTNDGIYLMDKETGARTRVWNIVP